MEIVTLDALQTRHGIGTVLLQRVEYTARKRGIRRLWLVTSNDNLDALRFYQRRGFLLCAVRPGAVEQARSQKPSIPVTGHYGIPLRDEIELDIAL
jgi:N-acetylglutamate synthase-like GNAT family acetyltransferase